MEARKEVEIRRSVTWEGSEFCMRTKGRSDSMATSPPMKRTAKAASPEVPRAGGHKKVLP